MADCTKYPEVCDAHKLLERAYDLLVEYRDLLEESEKADVLVDEDQLAAWKSFEEDWVRELECGVEGEDVEDPE